MKRFTVKVEVALDDPTRTEEHWVDVYKAEDVADLASEVLPHLMNQCTVISYAGQQRLESLIYKVGQIVKEGEDG